MAIVETLFQPPRRYLRYLHLREAVRLTKPRSVLVVGTGRAVAEVAIAKEFPETHFRLTDWDMPSRRVERAQRISRELNNVSYDRLDILSPNMDEKFDLVASVEVLEHIKQDDLAAANMVALASEHVFCLVPFATAEENASPRRRRRVWEKNEHYVVGYDPQRLNELFPNSQVMRGAYWTDVSTELKRTVEGLTTQEVKAKADLLVQIAHRDLRPEMPKSLTEAVGIWTLATTGAS